MGLKVLWLVQLGTPSSLSKAAVKDYLKEFLMDPKVIDIPFLWRWMLVNGIILPFRTQRSLEAYRKVWMNNQSPLLCYSNSFYQKLKKALEGDFDVRFSMRYGEPSMANVGIEIKNLKPQEVIILPLYPQFADTTTGSTLARARQILGSDISISPLREFYREEFFLSYWRRQIESLDADHLLFSYHGLPIRQIQKADPSGTHCLQKPHCCKDFETEQPRCYRAQCFQTSLLLRQNLKIPTTTAFQSRLGRSQWLGPSTESEIQRLALKGVKRLAVAAPSFMADCLETLEELGMRGRDIFLKNGGESFQLVPCPNDDDEMLRTLSEALRQSSDLLK